MSDSIFNFSNLFWGFFGALGIEILGFGFLRFLRFYTTVDEGHCQVFVLFGNVVTVLSEPGLHFLWPVLGWKSFVFPFLGKVYSIDLRMDQIYLRSQPVNSEEGAPMGVGVWYESFIHDPVSYLFKNTDPRGSLSANVSNATVRCLSNLPLGKMLEDRHKLSQVVRSEVSLKSQEWGYKLGSVYIRKVHFRDHNMIQEIEAKVVNRLKQVTASIKQDGDNQVRVITSTAQKAASIEFAKASILRPQIVGKVFSDIAKDPKVSDALFQILETQKLLENTGDLILTTGPDSLLANLVALKD